MYSNVTGVVDLQGKVCLVTGASRGIGKGIAIQLAFHGAICYITGRKQESLEAIKKEVEDMKGTGQCISVQCDHAKDDEVERVFKRIAEENNNRLDLLVNNAYAAVSTIFNNMKNKFWEQPPEVWDEINNVGLRNHYLCSRLASKMMVERRHGLIINISSPGGLRYLFSVPYGIGKAAKDRMAQDCAHELKSYGVAFISLWPGFAKTEFMMNVASKADLKRNKFDDKGGRAESVTYIGKTVVALLSESYSHIMAKTGKILLTTDIGREHGITDENGLAPISFLQLNYMLSASGFPKLASYVPDFVRLPFWFVRMVEAYKKS